MVNFSSLISAILISLPVKKVSYENFAIVYFSCYVRILCADKISESKKRIIEKWGTLDIDYVDTVRDSRIPS